MNAYILSNVILSVWNKRITTKEVKAEGPVNFINNLTDNNEKKEAKEEIAELQSGGEKKKKSCKEANVAQYKQLQNVPLLFLKKIEYSQKYNWKRRAKEVFEIEKAEVGNVSGE